MMVDAKEIRRRLENGVAMVLFFRKNFNNLRGGQNEREVGHEILVNQCMKTT